MAQVARAWCEDRASMEDVLAVDRVTNLDRAACELGELVLYHKSMSHILDDLVNSVQVANRCSRRAISDRLLRSQPTWPSIVETIRLASAP